MHIKYKLDVKSLYPITRIGGLLLLCTTACSKVTNRYGMLRTYGTIPEVEVTEVGNISSINNKDCKYKLICAVRARDFKGLKNLQKVLGNDFSTIVNTTYHRKHPIIHVTIDNTVGREVSSFGLDFLSMLISGESTDLNIKDKEGNTPIHIVIRYAAYMGNLDALRILMGPKGIDVNIKDEAGKAPIHIAVEYAAQNGHPEALKILVNTSRNIKLNEKDNQGRTALHYLIQYQIESSPFKLYNPYYDSGSIEVVCSNIVDQMLYFNSTPPQPDTQKITTLFNILLTAKGLDVNAKDNEGRTPLHLLAELLANDKNNRQIIFEPLLRHPDLNVNAKDSYGRSPLYVAAQYGSKEVVATLLKHPAIKVNKKATNGLRPVHIAAEKGHTDVLELLLNKKGIQPNKKDKDGETALHSAAKGNHVKVIDALVKHPEVILDIKGRTSGYTALDWAKLLNHKDCVTALEQAMKKKASKK